MRALQLKFQEEEIKKIFLRKQRLQQEEEEAFDNLC